MRFARAAVAALLAAVCLTGLPACGGDERLAELEQRAERARERIRERIERARERVRETLDDLEQSVPRASPSTPAPESRGRTEANQVEAYLTEVITSVDRYWTRTLAEAGRAEPRVAYVWVPPGRVVGTGCGTPAGPDAAFYCPADDTIYFAQQLAARLWDGIADDFPGERAGYGNAVGDFGVAYVVAHEYAHNVQEELGLFRIGQEFGAKPFELQADCMAGLWGNSVYREGRLQPGDVEEAMSTATAAGDFDIGNAQHHGTPEERRAAWLDGYRSGDPTVCGRYVPT
jgi:predicted metalloprotease